MGWLEDIEAQRVPYIPASQPECVRVAMIVSRDQYGSKRGMEYMDQEMRAFVDSEIRQQYADEFVDAVEVDHDKYGDMLGRPGYIRVVRTYRVSFLPHTGAATGKRLRGWHLAGTRGVTSFRMRMRRRYPSWWTRQGTWYRVALRGFTWPRKYIPQRPTLPILPPL